MDSIEARVTTGQLAGKMVRLTTAQGGEYVGRIANRTGAAFVLDQGSHGLAVLYADVVTLAPVDEGAALDRIAEVVGVGTTFVPTKRLQEVRKILAEVGR